MLEIDFAVGSLLVILCVNTLMSAYIIKRFLKHINKVWKIQILSVKIRDLHFCRNSVITVWKSQISTNIKWMWI